MSSDPEQSRIAESCLASTVKLRMSKGDEDEQLT